MTGRNNCTGTCETRAGCNCYGACCTGNCNQGRACRWTDTMPSAYGDDMYPRPMPIVVPCSTLARWALAWRRFWLG